MKWFEPKAVSLSRVLAPHYFVTDGIVLTKGNDLFSVIRLAGVDFECLTDDELESVSQRLHTAFKNLPDSYRIYQYIIKRKGVALDYHRANELYRFELFLAVMLDGKPGGYGSSLTIAESDLNLRAAEMKIQVDGFLAELPAQGEILTRNAIYSFLGDLTFSDPGTPQVRDHIDFWVPRQPIDVYRSHITVGRQTVKTLTLRELPRNTRPNLLTALARIPCDLILGSEYKRIPTDQAIKMFDASEDHFLFKKNNRNAKDSAKDVRDKGQKKERVVDTAAAENLTEVGEIKKRVANKGESLGEFSLTLVLRGNDLDRQIAKAVSVVGNMEGKLALDGRGTLDAYLSIIPGNKTNALRKQWLTSLNYADMSLVYGPATGSSRNEHLNSEALAILETSLGTVYHFNAHESDLLGVLIFGIQGSGKSFLTNLIADKSQKYRPFTFILDIGGSYKWLARSHGGTFIALAKRRNDFTINPFACEKTEDNLEFLSAFVHVLLGTSGYDPTPQECQLIDESVKVADRLSALELPDSLMDRLYNWCGNGRYAYLFDNAVDTLSLASFQAFDFQGVGKKVIEPLFFYIFHKISQVVYDPAHIGRPKELICDEVWKLLKNEVARDYIVESGKTFRKHNGGIILTTQSALDMEKVGLLEVVNEMCPTKILLANPGANKAHYAQIFELNEREVELFGALVKKKQLLLKTPMHSAVLSVMPTQEEIWRWSNDPNSNIRRDQMIAEHGYEKAKGMRLVGAA
jgi:type IV secretory pathway VirB4 component